MVLFFTFIFPCAFYNWFYIPFFRNMEYSYRNTELFTKFAAISLHSINLTYIICLIWGWIAGFIYGNTYAIVSDVLFTFIFPCIFYPYIYETFFEESECDYTFSDFKHDLLRIIGIFICCPCCFVFYFFKNNDNSSDTAVESLPIIQEETQNLSTVQSDIILRALHYQMIQIPQDPNDMNSSISDSITPYMTPIFATAPPMETEPCSITIENIPSPVSLSKDLECTICREIPNYPKKVYQCSEGHIICNICLDNLDKSGLERKCPTCREDWSNKLKKLPVRNRIAESIIRNLSQSHT